MEKHGKNSVFGVYGGEKIWYTISLMHKVERSDTYGDDA
jgi:hypothetical protein